MAFRRRPRRGFRQRFGAPFARQRNAWVTVFFPESTIDFANVVATELVLLQGDDWSQNANLQSDEKIKRIVFNGIVNIVPASTTLAFESAAWWWALYVIDNDESRELDPLNTALFDVHRMLQTGVIGGTVIEGTAAQTPSNIFPGFPVNIDLNRGLPRLTRDDLLVFAIRAASSTSAAVTTATISAISRCLIEA